MRAFIVSINCLSRPPFSVHSHTKLAGFPSKPTNLTSQSLTPPHHHLFLYCSNTNPTTSFDNFNDHDDFDITDDDDSYSFIDEEESVTGVGIFIQVKKLGKNSRRIRSKIAVNASLETVWNILTDYEKLADLIPGLAVSKLIDKKNKFARLYQIGQQDLAFGLKVNAKATLDCYEKDAEIFAAGRKRDIEFKMIEGDFEFFEGKWSIEEFNEPQSGDADFSVGQQFETTLSYFVDVKPKLWLPVHLIEGRICSEIKLNLICIREEAEKVIHNTLNAQ